jgi:hypothetical protein
MDERMFRDVGDMLAHIEDEGESEMSKDRIAELVELVQEWRGLANAATAHFGHHSEEWAALKKQLEARTQELLFEQEGFHVSDYVRVNTPDSAFDGMIGEVKSVNPIVLLIRGSDDVIDIGPFDASELELVKE